MARKSFTEELGVLRRYADLTEPYYKFLKEMMNSKSKTDKIWAAEQLSKAYVKMIPTQLTGDGGEPIQISWLSQSLIAPANGQNTSTTAQSAGSASNANQS